MAKRTSETDAVKAAFQSEGESNLSYRRRDWAARSLDDTSRA
jgi:hypothetical protein